jgi:integrase
MPNVAGEYVRRSVEDIEDFEGWPILLERYERVKAKEEFDVSQVYAGTFLTGGRINEILTLRPDMFTFKTEIIALSDGRQIARDVLEVRKMRLEKHYEKKGHYMEKRTEKELPRNIMRRLWPSEPNKEGFYERKRYDTEKKLNEVRKPFDIPFDEVPSDWRDIHKDFYQYLQQSKGQEWLFPSHTKNTHMTDSFIWKKFNQYGIYPHYLRGQRASCLISWNGLSMEQMMEWMSWEELKTAMHYGKMGKSKLLSVFKRFD